MHESKIMLATWNICRLRKKMKSVDRMVIRRINIIVCKKVNGHVRNVGMRIPIWNLVYKKSEEYKHSGNTCR